MGILGDADRVMSKIASHHILAGCAGKIVFDIGA
jgi:hypothetical protein